MINRIITRGMGSSRGKPGNAGMITMGYGGIFVKIAAQARRLIRVGQSGTKRAMREMQDAIVTMRLLRVNEKPSPELVIGSSVSRKINETKHVSVKIQSAIMSRVKTVWNNVKISVKRVK